MKSSRHKIVAQKENADLKRNVISVPTPYFNKPFAGFVYVKRRIKKPEMDEQGGVF